MLVSTQFLLLVLLIIIIEDCNGQSQSKSYGTLLRWKQMDFWYSSPQAREAAIVNEDFIPNNVIPIGIERWKHRLFVTTPRWKKGVPASLSMLPVSSVVQSPALIPYPEWKWHNADNCTGFTSILRIAVDHCGVMWALDAGQVESFQTPKTLCPPKIYAIDLETDTVISSFTIPKEYVVKKSLFTNLIVDSRDPQCRDLHVYIADTWAYGLIILRPSDAAFWRFSHNSFYPEPLLINYTLHGLNFQWRDGIFGMSLSPEFDNDRLMYYHAMSSSLEFYVRTSVLRDPSRVKDSTDEFKLLGDSRGAHGQVSAAAVDRRGIMFFNLVSQDSIGCWNTRKPYRKENLGIVAHNNETIVFPNDLRIDQETPQLVWALTNRLPMYRFNLLDKNKYNYRIIFIDPTKAVNNNQHCHL